MARFDSTEQVASGTADVKSEMLEEGATLTFDPLERRHRAVAIGTSETQRLRGEQCLGDADRRPVTTDIDLGLGIRTL